MTNMKIFVNVFSEFLLFRLIEYRGGYCIEGYK